MYLEKGSFFQRRPTGLKNIHKDILVRGSQHRSDEVEAFISEFDRLKSENDFARIEIFHDEGNKFDKNAIGVELITARKTWLGWKNRIFHVGFVEADLAKGLRKILAQQDVFTKLEYFKIEHKEKYPYNIIISIYSKT